VSYLPKTGINIFGQSSQSKSYRTAMLIKACLAADPNDPKSAAALCEDDGAGYRG
jgi:hypothetical protein